MTKGMKKIWAFVTRRKWLTAFVVLALIGGAGFAAAKGKNGLTSVSATRRDVVQEVTVSGKLRPVQSVDLAFEKAGKVASVLTKIGVKVQPGTRLVTLESGELSANLLQAKANLSAEIAKLAEMKEGTRPEEILIYEAKVETAELTLSDARKNLKEKLEDAFTKSDDAVRGKIDQLFSGSGGAAPQLNFSLPDGQLKAVVEQGRVAIEIVLDGWIDSTTLENEADLNPVIDAVGDKLSSVQVFLSKVASAVNTLTANTSLSQTAIDGYRTDVSTARANVNTAIANLSAAVEKWNTAKTSLSLAVRELDLKQAGSAPQAIASQEARVEEQRAAVVSIEAQLYKNTLISPIQGTVTFLEVKPGEIVSSGAKIVSVISEDALEIEAYVSEVNVGKVAVENPIRVTLDAFPGEEFSGKIIYLEPAETLIDGVVSFKVKGVFGLLDPRLKSGLTSNVYIETAKRENVIAISRFAVQSRDGKFFVLVPVVDGDPMEREVSLGLQGVDGFVEIQEGLSEGEAVLVTNK